LSAKKVKGQHLAHCAHPPATEHKPKSILLKRLKNIQEGIVPVGRMGMARSPPKKPSPGQGHPAPSTIEIRATNTSMLVMATLSISGLGGGGSARISSWSLGSGQEAAARQGSAVQHRRAEAATADRAESGGPSRRGTASSSSLRASVRGSVRLDPGCGQSGEEN
jgi:hypothetical protein